MLNVGDIIDNRYKILRAIGRGGTSCVFLAENIRLHNYWAIKEVYKGTVTENEEAEVTLIAESDILTNLHHYGLPTIVDILETSHSYLIVMEYIEGISMDKVLMQSGAQSEENVVKWGSQLCDILSYLHTRQPTIVYRDMKPANIILKANGNVVLIDFGMARKYKKNRNRDTANLGTHGYAAPEQYSDSQQSDVRTDIYSLGVTLYHLITGKDPCLPPYGIQPIRTVNPYLSPMLEYIIQKSTQIKPEDRYQSALEMKADLDKIMNGRTIAVESEITKKSSNKKWLCLFVAIPVILLIVVFTALTLAQSNDGNLGMNFIGQAGGIGDFTFENEPSALYCNQETEVYVSYDDERLEYSFVPVESGFYQFYSMSDENKLPLAWLSDSLDNTLGSDNTNGKYNDFCIIVWLDAGETYYLQTTLYYDTPGFSGKGRYLICVEPRGD